MLLYTVLKRPYVFCFLLVFLFLSIRRRGIFKTLVFLITGYFIAWLSEWCSINFGFPYGTYHYVYENLKGELLNHGVPVWDSLSYVFLCFAGLELVEFVRGPTGRNVKCILQNTFLSALFVTLLDVVIDPVAHLGRYWFLGEIYFYPHPGIYFDVPFSNFAGWFLVAFLINGIYLSWDGGSKNPPCLGGVLLYFSILVFNTAIAIFLKQWALVLADLFWIGALIFFLIFFLKPPKSAVVPKSI